MNPRVRHAVPADAPAIRALLRVLAPTLVPDPDDPAAAPFLESLSEAAVAERLAAPNYLHLVADRDGDLCGYIATRDGSHLFHFFVRPGLQRQGIGRLLWRKLLQVRPGPYTVNSSLAAVRFYLELGFVPAGEPQRLRCPPCLPMRYAGARGTGAKE